MLRTASAQKQAPDALPDHYRIKGASSPDEKFTTWQRGIYSIAGEILLLRIQGGPATPECDEGRLGSVAHV